MTTIGVASLIAVISLAVRGVFAEFVIFVGFLVSSKGASEEQRWRLYKMLARTSRGIAAISPSPSFPRKPLPRRKPVSTDDGND